MRVPILPPPGLVSNDTDFSGPTKCVDANNIRWRLGHPETIGGWGKYTSGALSGVCRNVLAWYDLSGTLNIAFGTNTNLYVYVNGTIYDITPAGLAAGYADGAGGTGFGAGAYGAGNYGYGSPGEYFPRTWSLDTWGQNLIASPRNGTIYIWTNNTASPATAIATAPAKCTSVLVTPERQILAFGCSQESGGAFNSHAVRGSDIQDYTNWTTASNNNVFEHILESNGGNIVSARMVGPYVGIWTDKGVFQATFLGQAGQTYQFDLQTTNAGLCGPNAVQVYNKQAYWVTPDYQFYTWAPGMKPALVPCPIRDDFKDHIAPGQFEKIAACSNGQFGEVWWFYPDKRDGGENSRYVQLNTVEGVWSRGTLARTACVDSGATKHPIYVGTDGYIYSHEDGNDANGSPLSWSLALALDYIDEGGRFVLIKGIEPDFQNQIGSVSIQLDLKKYPQSPERTYGPYSVGADKTRKHFLAQGRSGRITFSGNTAPAFARLGKPVLLAEPTGNE